MKNFSRDFVVNKSDDPQKILEEEAKALAQFNKVCRIKKKSSEFLLRSLEKRNDFSTIGFNSNNKWKWI